MDRSYTVLVADDEERIARLVRMYLEKDGAAVEETGDGQQALNLALTQDYDVVLLDWMMPGLSGLDVCQMLKSMKSTPVIMLTSRGEETDRLQGFEAGADDYVSKPFSPRELLCRIHAILKRTKNGHSVRERASADRFIYPRLVIDHDARRVTVDGHTVPLTLKEYELLRFFARNEGRSLSRETLFKEIWNHETYGDYRTVDTHVKRIREKINIAAPSSPSFIHTVWGIGYRFDAQCY
ncbi:response regulator transcription factor [Paenibacillus doosanensis]|uniref:Transcriptional regulatory protein SrrA n=1 Tax=Paenibacillus konkukensis TaxID=2020716 RepID=A0ABY4RE76_9BACL|nr:MULTISPECIES: response regulator transcription factor [Paenibacillus]MCS7462296.1 response regulator transcription factor [Paenibacillus doosanensis]UQZ80892.1 Transcriptional regulatory protein SrrA [Paenibacillus konkukensis]